MHGQQNSPNYHLSEYINKSKIRLRIADSSETSEDPYISARLRYTSEHATMRGCIPQSTSHTDHVKILTSISYRLTLTIHASRLASYGT